jgi:hypothetical protein
VDARTDAALPALASWEARCREHGLAFTAPRRAILRVRLEARAPLDAVAVLQGAREVHPGTSLGTTYRFLRELELHGLARAQPQPHGRMRWQLAVGPQPVADELRPLLLQLRHVLRELERLGLADAAPAVDQAAGTSADAPRPRTTT